MRFRVLTRLAVAGGFALLLGCAGPARAAAPARANAAAPTPKKAAPKSRASKSASPAGSFVVPDISRFPGTWLWVASEGLVATSTPETKGVARTLVLNPDLTYEFHQRRDTRDSLLCQGRFLFSEQSGSGPGMEATDYLDFEGWPEPYEHRMGADFEGPDTLYLVGDGCDNCPEHTFVRGRSTLFGGAVKRGEPFHRDLWDGLRFELSPIDLGWEIAIRDTTRPEDDLTSLTPPFHFVPNPRSIEGWHFRNKANTGPNQGDVNAPRTIRDFIFSRAVGKTILATPSDPDIGDQVARVGNQGRGVLTIEDLTLDPPAPGERAGIVSMRFTVAIEEARGARP